MKRMFTLIGLTVLALWCAGCQGGIGPEGPTGSPGSNGTDGTEGQLGPQGPEGPIGPMGSAARLSYTSILEAGTERCGEVYVESGWGCDVVRITDGWDIDPTFPRDFPALSCYLKNNESVNSPQTWMKIGGPPPGIRYPSGAWDFRNVGDVSACGFYMYDGGLMVWVVGPGNLGFAWVLVR